MKASDRKLASLVRQGYTKKEAKDILKEYAKVEKKLGENPLVEKIKKNYRKFMGLDKNEFVNKILQKQNYMIYQIYQR